MSVSRVMLILTAFSATALVQVHAEQEPTVIEALSARQAVRKGNRLLLEGNPTGALEAYNHAERL